MKIKIHKTCIIGKCGIYSYAYIRIKNLHHFATFLFSIYNTVTPENKYYSSFSFNSNRKVRFWYIYTYLPITT